VRLLRLSLLYLGVLDIVECEAGSPTELEDFSPQLPACGEESKRVT
jgi:hypothetical protein